MIYELPLDVCSPSFPKIEIEKNKVIKKNLEEISDFKTRLEYYNNNIQSLSLSNMAGHIYFEWGLPDQRIKIYCGCKDCRKTDDFSTENESIYFSMRNKEVTRIHSAIKKGKSYKEKLKILFGVKGFFPHLSPKVYANSSYDPLKDSDSIFYSKGPLIDLAPESKEQIAVYNEFVKAEFDKKYRNSNSYSEEYKCFNCEKEIERINLALINSIDPHNLLLYCRGAIYKHFDYPNCLNKTENRQVQDINIQLNRITLGLFLFPKMMLGVEIDLNKIVLDEHELLRYTHISEIVKFCKFLDLKINERYKRGGEITVQAEKRMLSELVNDNSAYNALMDKYSSKIMTAIGFMSKSEFINAEISRIENDFMSPIPFAIGGDFNLGATFSLEKFARIAFDSLLAGNDREVKPLLELGKKEFVQFRSAHTPGFSIAENAEEINSIADSTFAMLQKGVAFLRYHKFLKEQIRIYNPQKVEKTKDEQKFSQRQIAIAYFFLGEQITKENAGKILNELSDTQSVEKLLSKRISKVSELTSISENRTKDTKHQKDLEAAKRLISGKKNKKALKDVSAVITAFANNYKSHYQ